MRKISEKRKQYQREFRRKYYKDNKESCLQDAHDTYIYFKNLKICTCCHSEPAKETSTLCLNCSDKRSIENMERMKKIKDSPEHKQKVKMRNKKRYEKVKAMGICYVCGKREPIEGKKICYECSIKRKRQNIKQKKGVIPRSARASFGACYFCGEPVLPNRKVCQKHYDICVRKFTETNKHPQIPEHPWRNQVAGAIATRGSKK